MFALPSPAFCDKYKVKSKLGQCIIVMSEGIVFRATVDKETRELCIMAYGVPGKDAHIKDPEVRKELKLDAPYYHLGPCTVHVHLWVAGAFGLNIRSEGGIDHLNRITSDNRVVNLYSANRKEQAMNQTNNITYYKP